MNLTNFFIYAMFIAGTIDIQVFVKALTCKSCYKRHGKIAKRRKCPPVNGCKGGLTMSVCGCCKACAKVPGEYCGGVFGTNGRCDEGLACVTISKPYRIADDHHELGKCAINPALPARSKKRTKHSLNVKSNGAIPQVDKVEKVRKRRHWFW